MQTSSPLDVRHSPITAPEHASFLRFLGSIASDVVSPGEPPKEASTAWRELLKNIRKERERGSPVIKEPPVQVVKHKRTVSMTGPSWKGKRAQAQQELSRRIVPVRHVEVVKNIASGSFGRLFRCVVQGKRGQYALKCPKWDSADESEGFEEISEAQWAELRAYAWIHRYSNVPAPILNYVGWCQLDMDDVDSPDPETPSVIIEYVPQGNNVYAFLYDERHYLSALNRHRMVVQVLGTFDWLHSIGMLHRDIKTENFLLCFTETKAEELMRDCDEWNFGIKTMEDLKAAGSSAEELLIDIRICDFGFAVLLGEKDAIKSSRGRGTSRYMSPESSEGDFVGKASDVWSIACCIIELLGGPVPYEHDLTAQAGYAREKVPPGVPKHFPPRVRDMLERCLDVDALSRPTTADILELFNRVSPQELHTHGCSHRMNHAFTG